MMTKAPDQKWPDSVWLEDEFGDGSDDQFQYGSWDCRNIYNYDAHYLRATPARVHAEELADLLREALEELDEYYRAEYDTDHPYHQDKLARARGSWAHARDILARIEGEASK